MSGFYEKSGNADYNSELAEAYKKMADLLAEKDTQKWVDMMQKLVNLYCTMGDIEEVSFVVLLI